jgi:VanZ family protein
VQKFFYFIVGLLLLVLIWGLSVSKTSVPYIHLYNLDKIGHFLAYAVVGVWFLRLFQLRRYCVMIIGVLVFTAASTEVAQAFIPTRQADFKDFFCNLTGIIVAYVVFAIFFRKQKKSSRSYYGHIQR